MPNAEAHENELAVLVEKARVDATVEALDGEGVYDDARKLGEYDAETVAVPVTEPPSDTPVRAVVRDAGLEPRVTSVADRLRLRGWTDDELSRVPNSWAVIGDVVLVRFPEECPRPGEVGEALLDHHGADTVLARGGIDGPHREPQVEVVAGSGETETVHREHGTEYRLDLAAVMFSPGNKAERVQMGEVVDADERVVDMFAGVGYFTLPMARAGAAVTAIERNPVAYEYLVENAERNGVSDRVAAVRGDCRDVLASRPPRVADRVVMGHYDAAEYLDAALETVAPGGVVHLHAATPDALLWERPLSRLRRAADDAGRAVETLDRRRVKTYSGGVSHVVVDARVV